MTLTLAAKLYIIVISLFALLILAHFVPLFAKQLQNPHFFQAMIIFSVLAFLTQVCEIVVVPGRHTTTAYAISIAAILLGGTPLTLLVVFIGTLTAEIVLRWRKLALGFMNFLYRVTFNTGQIALSAFAGSLIFSLLGGLPFILLGSAANDHLMLDKRIVPAIGAFATYTLLNLSLVSIILALITRTGFVYHLRFNLRHLPVQLLSLGVLGILTALLYTLSPWYLLLILVPLGLVHFSLRNYMKLRHQAQKTFERVAELLSARDPYTYEHSNEVAVLAEQTARKLKLNQDQLEKIRSAAVIHDIGKLGVPDRILQKPGPLTEEEWVIMKKHPEIGADLLKDLEIDTYIIDVVRYEHERWDGSGYPQGLKGEEIPIGARIVAVADVYNALTTDRPYRPAYSHEEALRMLRKMRGTELDPQVVDALFVVLEDPPALAAHTPTKVEVH